MRHRHDQLECRLRLDEERRCPLPIVRSHTVRVVFLCKPCVSRLDDIIRRVHADLQHVCCRNEAQVGRFALLILTLAIRTRYAGCFALFPASSCLARCPWKPTALHHKIKQVLPLDRTFKCHISLAQDGLELRDLEPRRVHS
jgi:hypothetical protein